jgi:hypothetical protein
MEKKTCDYCFREYEGDGYSGEPLVETGKLICDKCNVKKTLINMGYTKSVKKGEE